MQISREFGRNVRILMVLLMAAALAGLPGCATLKGQTERAEIQETKEAARPIVLTSDVALSLPGGLAMAKIRAGTALEFVGTIPQGRVLRPVKTIVTVLATDTSHEAYPVEADHKIVGLFLPVEDAFVRASTAVAFSTKESP